MDRRTGSTDGIVAMLSFGQQSRQQSFPQDRQRPSCSRLVFSLHSSFSFLIA